MSTLETLIKQAGLRLVVIQNHQRYSLANHLRWLCNGEPGGHHIWSFLDSPALSVAYSSALASIGHTDTIIAYIENIDRGE